MSHSATPLPLNISNYREDMIRSHCWVVLEGKLIHSKFFTQARRQSFEPSERLDGKCVPSRVAGTLQVPQPGYSARK